MNIQISVISILYLLLNLSFNIYSKYLFQHFQFNFPILIMLCHQTGIFITIKLLILCGFVEKLEVKEMGKIIFPCMVIGSLFGLNIITNNSSLVYISLTLNQCIKATSPVFVMFFAYCLEKKKYSFRLYFSGFLTVVGVYFCTTKNPSFNATGILLCVSSTVLGSLQSSISALILESSPNLIVYITMYNALIVCFWCIPMVIWFELE
jgi:drug/metabolite transporter (DMT)-like permease